MYIDYSAVRIVTIDICNLGHTEFIATHVVCHILQGIFLLHPHASIPIYFFYHILLLSLLSCNIWMPLNEN